MFDLMLNFPYFVCSTVKPTFLEKTHMTFYDCYENPIKSLQIPILSYLFLGKITSIQPIHPGFFPPVLQERHRLQGRVMPPWPCDLLLDDRPTWPRRGNGFSIAGLLVLMGKELDNIYI